MECVLRHDRSAAGHPTLYPGDPDTPEEAYRRAVSAAQDYLGVTEIVGSTELTLVHGFLEGIRGAALVELYLDVIWRLMRYNSSRVWRAPRPSTHVDTWDGLVDSAATLRISATVVRPTIPLRQAHPNFVRRCIADLNPQQDQAVLQSHTTVVSLIQGPPGTGTTTTLAHLVASHLESLPEGAFIVVCAHTHCGRGRGHATLCAEFQRAPPS